MLLHPQLGDFRFQLIRDKIEKCVKWIETDSNAAKFKTQKIKFLNGLIAILDKFNQDDCELKRAIDYFKAAIKTRYGTTKNNGGGHLVWLASLPLQSQENLFQKLYKKSSLILKKAQEHDKEANLFCGLLKNSTIAQEFWPKLELETLVFIDDQSLNSLKEFAVNVLNQEKNQSDLERLFAILARKELGRNRLTIDQMIKEANYRCILKQWSIFKDCGYDSPELKVYESVVNAVRESEKVESEEVESEEVLDQEVFKIGQTIKCVGKPMLEFDKDSEDEGQNNEERPKNGQKTAKETSDNLSQMVMDVVYSDMYQRAITAEKR